MLAAEQSGLLSEKKWPDRRQGEPGIGLQAKRQTGIETDTD